MTPMTRAVVMVVLMLLRVAAPALAQTGNTIHYVYDELGRLIAVTDPAGDTVTYTYDEVGNVLSIGRYASSQISIISFSPGAAPVGTAVTINGTGFSATANQNTVLFNGVAASVSSATTTQLIASVPSGATTGPISVTSPAGTAASSSAFLVTTGNGVPVITSFTPAIGTSGTSVTVTGANFQPVVAQNAIKFNITYGSVQTVTGFTQLVGTVPAPATSGPITITTPFGTGVSATDFFVPPSPYTPPDVVSTARLTPGVTQVATIGTAAKIALLTFAAAAGERISVNFGAGLIGDVAIYRPDGVLLTTAALGPTFIEPMPITVSGTHTIVVDPPGTSVGSTAVTLYKPVDVTGTISPGGTSVSVPIDTPGQNGLLTFSGTAGQSVSASIVRPLGTFGCSWYLTILKPDGSVLGSTSACGGTTAFLDTQTLPVTGTYTLVIDPTGTQTGTVSATLYGVTHVTGPITSDGTPVNVPLTTPGQNGLLTFSGTSGQKMSASIVRTSGTFGCSWYLTILKPDGVVLASTSACGGTTAFLDTQTLPVTGTYTLVVDPTGIQTGTVNAALYGVTHVTGPITSDGTAVTVPLTTPGQNGLLTFSGTAGQKVSASITRTSGTFGCSWYLTILKPDGSALGSTSACGGTTLVLSTQTLPVAGTYSFVIDPTGMQTGTVSAVLSTVP